MTSKKRSETRSLPIEQIAKRILLVRGQKVILDADLAELYGTETKRLNEQVKRNIRRFPEDFCFQLSREEYSDLRSQFATSRRHGGRRYMPYVFTEHGALMAATVLNTPLAVEVSVYVVRAFVELREVLAANQQLAAKLVELEHKVGTHDAAITELIEALRQLMTPPVSKNKRTIGFAPWNKD
jgi:phage regulator Rha-like protein